MSNLLTGQVAFVSGSGRGLGNAIAERLAHYGADVAIYDISQEAPAEFGEAKDLTEVAERLGRFGVRSAAVTGDIADEAAVTNMAATVLEALGPITILVNCAGGDIALRGGKPNPNTALGIPLEDARAIIDRNFIGTMLMCRAFCPGMIERRSGSVINIASSGAHLGTSPEVVYCSVKAAIVHYTRCLAFELKPHNVRVNAVSPGPTKTGRFLATRVTDPARLVEEGTLTRYGVPREVADAVAYLASDMASFVNGQVLRVDGGATLGQGKNLFSRTMQSMSRVIS